MRWFREALVASLLAEMALSPKLWRATRPYPTVPLIDGTPMPPPWVTLLLTSGFLAGLTAIAVLPRPRVAILAALGFGTALILFDVSRLQPWIYEAGLMLVALLRLGRRDEEAWSGCAAVVVGLYVWSGAQKLNATFATEIFPWLFRPLGADWVEHLRPFWAVAPLGEIAVGLLLAFRRTRRVGVGVAWAMHSLLLGLLGPFGHDYNSVVWPWSLGSAFLATILFWRNDAPLVPSLRFPTVRALALVAWGLPALNYAGLWDGFLAWSYYSGRLRDGWIRLSPEGARRFEALYPVSDRVMVREGGGYRVDVVAWGFEAMNVPPYAERRVYRAVARQLVAAGIRPSEMTLLVRDRAAPWAAPPTLTPVDAP